MGLASICAQPKKMPVVISAGSLSTTSSGKLAVGIPKSLLPRPNPRITSPPANTGKWASIGQGEEEEEEAEEEEAEEEEAEEMKEEDRDLVKWFKKFDAAEEDESFDNDVKLLRSRDKYHAIRNTLPEKINFML